jgi:hypothetical protein
VRIVSRPYELGDEVQINKLYLAIAGRDRSEAEFAWEWLHTWDGRGTMDLAFDLDREEGDQLVAQYSLIPTPLSVWGRPVLAGKTENCMSHPALRGTGFYSRHEREWFEREKQRYSFFFTTAGQVSGGAVGKVRVKLGYTAFDDWANATLWLRTGKLREELTALVPGKGRASKALAPWLGGLLAVAVQTYSLVRRRHRCAYRTAVHAAGQAPLDDIAGLWQRNRERYGISVERTADYLRWRLDGDPHLRHEYLVLSNGAGVAGYAVYFIQCGTLHIVDALVDGADTELFRHLMAALVGRARQLGVDSIRCLALRRSRLLPRLLRSAGFFDTAVLSPSALVRGYRQPRQFFLYIPEELRSDARVADHANWYITELVLEGLPRPTSSA